MSNYITTVQRAELFELEREIQELGRTLLSGCFTPSIIARKMEEIERKIDFIDPEVDREHHAKVKREHASATTLYVRLTEKE